MRISNSFCIFFQFIFFLFFLLTCLAPGTRLGKKKAKMETLKTRIERLHAEAQRLVEQSAFDEAEAKLDSILAIEPDAAAYFRLGVIHSKVEHYKTAEYYFRKALKVNRKFAQAYYELGMLYKNGPFPKNDAIQMFRWAIRHDRTLKDAYFQRALLIMQYHDYEPGQKKLEKLVLMDPDYKDCYNIYLRIGLAFYEYARMESFFPKLISTYPNNPQYQLDLIKILHRDRKYFEAVQQLNDFKTKYPNFSIALQSIYEARIQFALGMDSSATELYWKGIDLISSETEANEYFSDIIFIVKDDEYDQYMSASISGKKRFFLTFWKSRDPTLTTPYNERLPEHYQRLRYARKYNRRYPQKEFLSFFLEDFSKPLERADSTVLMALGATRGCKEQQEIDEQGVIHIRHGPPDKFATFMPEGGGFDVNMNVSWLYEAKYGRPQMLFHFIRAPGINTMADGWRLEILPRYAQERGSLDARYYDRYKYLQLAEENINSIELATTTETCNYAPEPGQFELAVSSFIFKGRGNEEDFYLFYELSDAALSDTSTEGKAEFRHEIVIFDSDWYEIQRFDKTESIAEIDFNANKKPLKKYLQSLAPGEYHLGMRVTNLHSKRNGNLRAELSVPSNHSSGLKVAGIMLGHISANESSIINQRLEQSAANVFIPNIDRQFQRNEPILIYFEIYNLELDENSETAYTISLRVTQKEKYASTFTRLYSKIKQIFIEEQFAEMTVQSDYSGSNADEFMSRAILLPDYPHGVYELSIIVVDNVAGVRLVRKVDFEIVNLNYS